MPQHLSDVCIALVQHSSTSFQPHPLLSTSNCFGRACWGLLIRETATLSWAIRWAHEIPPFPLTSGMQRDPSGLIMARIPWVYTNMLKEYSTLLRLESWCATLISTCKLFGELYFSEHCLRHISQEKARRELSNKTSFLCWNFEIIAFSFHFTLLVHSYVSHEGRGFALFLSGKSLSRHLVFKPH